MLMFIQIYSFLIIIFSGEADNSWRSFGSEQLFIKTCSTNGKVRSAAATNTEGINVCTAGV